QRAAALCDAAGSEVEPRLAEQTPQIDAAMVEEAVVLGREDGLQQAEGDVAKPYRPVVLAGTVTRAGEDLGLERGGADVAPVARDLHDAVVARLDAHALRVAQSR